MVKTVLGTTVGGRTDKRASNVVKQVSFYGIFYMQG